MKVKRGSIIYASCLRSCVTSYVTRGSETWPIKKAHEEKLDCTVYRCLKWSKEEAGSPPQSEVECPSPEIFFLFFFLSENGEFWCILGGILCYLELQKSKQETRYRPVKSKGAGSPTLATRPHFKPWTVLKQQCLDGYVVSN